MSFEVSADAYGLFMGRFSEPLADLFVDYCLLEPGDVALDVGCGPGVLTSRLVDRLGAEAVTAVDPSGTFVAACRARVPGVDVRLGEAEDLDLPDDSVDAAVASLVVHFMTDAVRGLRQMARVTRSNGLVAACVWDHEGGRGPLSTFWDAVRVVDPAVPGEGHLPGTRRGHLGQLMRAAGIDDVDEGSLEVTVPFGSFEEWWEPYLLGVGPAGSYLARVEGRRQHAIEAECRSRFPDGPFDVTALAWSARGVVA